LVALYNRERAFLNAQKQEKAEETLEGKNACPMAFSELVTYITETKKMLVRVQLHQFSALETCLAYTRKDCSS